MQSVSIEFGSSPKALFCRLHTTYIRSISTFYVHISWMYASLVYFGKVPQNFMHSLQNLIYFILKQPYTQSHIRVNEVAFIDETATIHSFEVIIFVVKPCDILYTEDWTCDMCTIHMQIVVFGSMYDENCNRNEGFQNYRKIENATGFQCLKSNFLHIWKTKFIQTNLHNARIFVRYASAYSAYYNIFISVRYNCERVDFALMIHFLIVVSPQDCVFLINWKLAPGRIVWK